MDAYTKILALSAAVFIAFYGVQRYALRLGGYHYTDAPDTTARKANTTLLAAGVILFSLSARCWNLWMGEAPAYSDILAFPSDMGLPLTPLLAILSATAGYASARKVIREGRQKDFPPPSAWRLYFPLRAMFILTYEAFFRGALFFPIVALHGIAPAMAVNTVLYWVAHMHGDRGEKTGAILFGPILCGLAYHHGSCWPAAIVHLSLTLSHEIPLGIHAIRMSKANRK
jgi:membrane protease YdiL (CAAX protease family)